MKTMREAYFENYRKVQTPAGNRRGFRTTYQYTGEWLGWGQEAHEMRRTKILLLLLEAAGIGFYLAGALLSVPFNRLRITSGLAVLSLIPWIAEIWGVVRLAASSMVLKKPDFDEIRNCITVGGSIHMVLLASAILTGIISLLTSGQISGGSLLAAAGHLVSGAASCLVFLRYIRIPVEEYLEKP